MSSTTDLSVKKFYESRWIEPGAYSHQPGRRVFDLLEKYIRPDSRCLDVGCGDGHILGPFLGARAKQYTGVDISENAVRHGRVLGLDLRPIEDASSLPFESCLFDVVLCMEVFEHLFQPQVAAQEILRVLRTGGMLIATVPNLTQWRRRFLFFVAGRWDPYGDALSVEQPWRDPHIRFFTSITLQRMLSRAGFSPVRVFGEEPAIVRRIPWMGDRLSRLKTLPLLPICLSHQLIAVAFKPTVSAA